MGDYILVVPKEYLQLNFTALRFTTQCYTDLGKIMIRRSIGSKKTAHLNVVLSKLIGDSKIYIIVFMIVFK